MYNKLGLSVFQRGWRRLGRSFYPGVNERKRQIYIAIETQVGEWPIRPVDAGRSVPLKRNPLPNPRSAL